MDIFGLEIPDAGPFFLALLAVHVHVLARVLAAPGARGIP